MLWWRVLSGRNRSNPVRPRDLHAHYTFRNAGADIQSRQVTFHDLSISRAYITPCRPTGSRLIRWRRNLWPTHDVRWGKSVSTRCPRLLRLGSDINRTDVTVFSERQRVRPPRPRSPNCAMRRPAVITSSGLFEIGSPTRRNVVKRWNTAIGLALDNGPVAVSMR